MTLSELTIVEHGIVISLDEKNRVFKDGAVAIREDRILEVNKTSVINKKYKADAVINAKGKVVLPGLINCHTHSGSIRGIGDNLPLYDWLETYIKPETQEANPAAVYAMARLSYCEALKSGTTCILDMYRFMHKCADAAGEIGNRVVLVPNISDQLDYYDKFEDNEKLVREKNGSHDGRINVWYGLHSFRDCSPELLEKVSEHAAQDNVGIHTHSNESISDVELAKERYGKRPIEHLYDHGITGPRVLLAHCVWLSHREMKILEETGTKVAHCPIANMKLGDGISPVPTLLERGIKVGLGTDGSKESNGLDMFNVMKFTALLHTVNSLDTTIMPADKVLWLTTQGGAQALGLEKQLGSLEAGKKADLIIVDMMKLHTTPILFEPFNLISHLVYAVRGSDVDTVMVNGKVVVENQVIKTVDERQVIQEATDAAKDLLERMK